ncbi:MAG: hypothetical protein AAF633_23030 [Chloroflexota bacterium]
MNDKTEVDLRVLARLLNAGFSASDLYLLTFELDPEGMNDSISQLPTSEMVVQIIRFAYRQRRLDEVVAYVKAQNPKRYAEFEACLYVSAEKESSAENQPDDKPAEETPPDDGRSSINIYGNQNVTIGDVTGRDKIVGDQVNEHINSKEDQELKSILKAISDLLKSSGA